MPASDESAAIEVVTEPSESLAARARAFDEAEATGRLLMALDPKVIRSTEFKNRDPHALLVHDQDFVELTRGIQRSGQHTPIRVRPVQNAAPYEYEIVFGHRRHAACLVLDAASSNGFQVLATIDSDCSEAKNLVLKMYQENATRLDLSAYETGRMFQQWLDAKIFPFQDSIAAAIGKSKQLVGKYLALARLPDYVLKAFGDPRRISLRWGPELNRQLDLDPASLKARAEAISGRKPAPASDEVFAELMSGSERRRLPRRKDTQVVKDGNRVLFQITTRPGRYEVRMGRKVELKAYRGLEDALKEWLVDWMKNHPAS
jgi:ParB/RepB/Spo0J family partition protein